MTVEEVKKKYTFVKVPSADTADIRVGFTIGVQTFHLELIPENLEHALWHQEMLARALFNLIEIETKGE